MKKNKNTARSRRKMSIRNKVFGTPVKPRLSVFRSNLHFYGQLIDDENSKTLLSISSNSTEVEEQIKSSKEVKGKKGVAFVIGSILGKKMNDAMIENIVFDRNGYLYHGRVKAFADGVRKSGIKF
ncbi:MAG: 50S ribosomal protein L18 [Candidatus Delongbacteria bacterium]|jgi:large subunit ribosomal protein L18|nr:50S ribosomal protein L18 [Candidatus Delongbacteria bacterium]